MEKILQRGFIRDLVYTTRTELVSVILTEISMVRDMNLVHLKLDQVRGLSGYASLSLPVHRDQRAAAFEFPRWRAEALRVRG